MKKRMLAVLLAFCLMVAMMPAALAESNGGDVAQIERTGVRYPSIKAAVDAAENEDTVTVIRSHVINCGNPTGSKNSIIEVDGKSVAIDLNGKSMTGTVDYAGEVTFFSCANGANLTLKDGAGGGSISITTLSSVHSMMRVLDSASKLTVEGGSYQIDKVTSALFYTSSSENVIVNGGTFRLGNVGTGANGSPWIFNVSGKNEGHIKVNGGTFNANVFNQYWIFEAQGPQSMALIKSGADTWTMVKSAAYTSGRERSGNWYGYPLGYTSLEAAIAAADQVDREGIPTDAPENVVLMDTCPVDGALTIPQSFTIVLNGHTVKWEGNDTDPMFSVVPGKTLTIANFTPVRDGYSFAGWYSDAARTIPYDLAARRKVEGGTTGAELYAKWELEHYTVTWLDEDGSILEEDQDAYIWGQTPSYDGTEPVKAADGKYTYRFIGWSPEVSAVEGDVTYTAKYQAISMAVPVPETGDHDLPILCGVLALVSLLGLALVKRLDEHI